MKLIDLIGCQGYMTRFLTNWNITESNRVPTKYYPGIVIYIKLDDVFKVNSVYDKFNVLNYYGYILNQIEEHTGTDPKYIIKGKVYLSSGIIIPIQSNKSFFKSELLKYMHSQEVPYSLKLNEINVFT